MNNDGGMLARFLSERCCTKHACTDSDGVPDHVYSAVYIPEAPDYTKPFKRQQLADGKNLHDWIPLDPASQDSDFGVIPLQDLEMVKLVEVPPRKG